MRKATLLVLTLFFLTATGHAAMFRRGGSATSMMPRNKDIPDLTLNGKILTYTNEKLKNYYGSGMNMYSQYGIDNLVAAEYTYGASDRRVTIEIANMQDATSAAGLFHYYRGNIVEDGGRPVDMGAEGVIDSGRENRNLYFYRAKNFVKIIYSGKDPVPDLMTIAGFIDGKAPGGRDEKPAGIDMIKVNGVNPDTVAVTPGYCFNLSFFPPAVWASAPGGGSVASDVFIMTRNKDSEAAELFNDYLAYLKLTAEYFEEYRRDRQRYLKAVDPNQGRVVATAYRNALIVFARPDGYERAEPIINAVMAKMDELDPPRRRR